MNGKSKVIQYSGVINVDNRGIVRALDGFLDMPTHKLANLHNTFVLLPHPASCPIIRNCFFVEFFFIKLCYKCEMPSNSNKWIGISLVLCSVLFNTKILYSDF